MGANATHCSLPKNAKHKKWRGNQYKHFGVTLFTFYPIDIICIQLHNLHLYYTQLLLLYVTHGHFGFLFWNIVSDQNMSQLGYSQNQLYIKF